MAYNDVVLNSIVRHQIELLRLGNSYARDVVKQLRKAQRALYDQIASMTIVAGTPDRILALRLQITQNLVEQFYRAIRDRLTKELDDVADYEADAIIRILTQGLPNDVNLSFDRPSEQQIIAAALVPTQGRTTAEWFSDLSQAAITRATSIVRQGFIDGLTPQQMARSVRDAFELDMRGASSVARTMVMNVAMQARELVYQENKDLISEILWVSTLDNRTTPICQERDGMRFPVGEGPRPPAHINCRSTTTPIVKGADALGLPPSTRASMDGQVPEDLTYGQWLKQQPASVQDEVLGPTRGKLFRQGNLPLDRFINDEGKYYTLAELRRREASAFNKAGI